MGKKTKTPTLTKKITKKQAREMVFNKLAGALEEYKEKISEKKFRTKLKKASKLFAADIAKAENKDSVIKEKPSKKAPKVTPVQADGETVAVEQETPYK